MSRALSSRARIVCAAAVVSLAAPAGAGAVATDESPREIREYWTAERKANAIPADRLLEDVAPPAAGLGDLGLEATPSARGGQVTATKVQKPRKRHIRTHGKVFFRQGLSNFVCSGTSVNSKHGSLVVTAGHCTYSNGYVSNFMFAPAYDNGPSNRFGEWTATKLKAMPQWENSEDLRYDVAFATMAKRQGETLKQVVGARKMGFNKGRNLRFDVYGYPAEGRFSGQQMYHCDSPAQGTDRGPAPQPTRISCDMTGGSSGGGWVIGGGRVNSVVSYGYECTIPIGPICKNSEEGNLFGPYFGDAVRQLYRSQRQ